ncbi:MAG: type II toxin-antitoxin system VapC family toxin [Nanoarchaeota archaeon]
MERQKKVIDASVVFKWFDEEKDSDKALRIKENLLKGDLILIVPDLIILEVLNALRYKKKNEKELNKASQYLFDVGFKIELLNMDIISKAIENSVRYSITIYDALYVALAQIYGAVLITADEKLYKIPNVIALEKI